MSGTASPSPPTVRERRRAGGSDLPGPADRHDMAEPALRALRALRPALAGLGYGIATQWDRGAACGDPAEYRLAARMTSGRRADFLVGRRALRRALADLGMSATSSPLLIGDRKQPQLPPGVTASLSHSQGIAVALAGPSEKFCSAGIDLELSSLPTESAHLVLTEPERSWLANCGSAAERARRLRTAFAAKEAAYKALDPVVGVATLRRIQLIPAGSGFVAWPSGLCHVRLDVRIHQIGTGVLAWTLLPAKAPSG
jgi:enterobactin synthetase component D